jgi:hypothetical protein
MLGAGFVSCEEYLDKTADATVTIEPAFQDWFNFQGYVEQLYANIPNKVRTGYNVSFNWGDDEMLATSDNAKALVGFRMDLGDFRAYYQGTDGGASNYLYHNVPAPGDHPDSRTIFQNAWRCIRQANLGLENLDKLIGTDEERDMIAGQLYFFRAWFHFQMMIYVGGLPYIDRTLSESDDLHIPRLSYQETADKVAEDFRKAADLLPIDWDMTEPGSATQGSNQLRINKIMALGYLGKNYLWAASPLMENGAQVGGINSGMTYVYNEDYAKKAAEAFGELLTLVENGETQYAMVTFDYSDIYEHTTEEAASYSDLNYNIKGSGQPGSTEAIFRGPTTNGSAEAVWNYEFSFQPTALNNLWNQSDPIVRHPTANAVNMYGMANGLPLDDPESGFDPTHQFKNRDPRFYHDILFDGVRYVNGDIPQDEENKLGYRYISTYTNSTTSSGPGPMRSVINGSATGYFIQKLVPKKKNEVDAPRGPSDVGYYISYMRLADIYLMYAEACAAFGGADGKASNFFMTAADAVNKVRDRLYKHLPDGPTSNHVAAKYLADDHKFMDEVRRERAVELMFEGHRFNDLQRWLLLTESPYNEKYAQDFTRVESLTWLANNDPANAQVGGWNDPGAYYPIVIRPLGVRHYWFPFPDNDAVKDAYLYPEFEQNPGW